MLISNSAGAVAGDPGTSSSSIRAAVASTQKFTLLKYALKGVPTCAEAVAPGLLVVADTIAGWWLAEWLS